MPFFQFETDAKPSYGGMIRHIPHLLKNLEKTSAIYPACPYPAISKSLQIFNQIQVVSDPKKNIIVIASDAQSRLDSEAASAVYHSNGWKVSHLGDMSSSINVLFDLDFQKLIGKIWKQKSGILVIVVFSKTDEGLNFFADSINPIIEKSGKQMKLALCGKVSKKTKIRSDLTSEKIEDILQWSQTVSENIK